MCGDGHGVVVGSGVLVVVEHVGEALQGGLGQVAAFAVLPLLALLEQDGADQAGDGLPVGEDLDNVGAALDLGVDTLDGVVGPDFLPVLPGKAANAVRSASASASMSAISGKASFRELMTCWYWAVTASWLV